MDFQKTGFDAVKGVHMAMDRDDWYAPVNMVISFRVPKITGKNSLLVNELLAYQEWLWLGYCSTFIRPACIEDQHL